MTKSHTHLTGQLQAGLAISIKEELVQMPGYSAAPSAFAPATCQMTTKFNDFIIELNKRYAEELDGFVLNTAHVKTLFTRMNVNPIWPRQQGNSFTSTATRLNKLEQQVATLIDLVEVIFKRHPSKTIVRDLSEIHHLKGM